MEVIKDGYFWESYDQASKKAGLNPEWDRLEMQREYACDQAGIPDHIHESIKNSHDQH